MSPVIRSQGQNCSEPLSLCSTSRLDNACGQGLEKQQIDLLAQKICLVILTLGGSEIRPNLLNLFFRLFFSRTTYRDKTTCGQTTNL